MHSLTIVYTTARQEPELGWFLNSLWPQCAINETPAVIVVDFHHDTRPRAFRISRAGVRHVAPKPTIWQGPHRMLPQNWWANSNARNTGLCLAMTDWIAFIDDRCVIAPTWMDAVREAMAGGYIVCGSYEKRHGMKVDHGRIIDQGVRNSMDNRWEHVESLAAGNMASAPNPYPCNGSFFYGCALAMPMEWALHVGGFEEAMDGQGFEDQITGMMFHNNGFPMKYDIRMHCVQDRTPEICGTVFRREDKGVSPNDKSHRALEVFGTARNTSNRHALLQSRAIVQRGGEFPVLLGARTDWWDGEVIDELYPRAS